MSYNIVNNDFNLSGTEVFLSKIGSPTYSTTQHLINFALSAGVSSGGGITDAGSGNINAAAGTGFIRATDNSVADLKFFDWATLNGIAIPSNTTRYVGVAYNSGSPQVTVKTSDVWDLDTEFPLGIVVNEGGSLYILNNPFITADNQTNLIERFDSLANISRDERLKGLILGNTGTRKVTVSSGSLLSRMSEFAISAIDTSVANTFDAYYRDGSGGWTKQSVQTQWDNTKYDDGSGTLASLTVLDYFSRWFYLMTDGSLAMIYGQNQFTSLALGLGDTIPSSAPDRILKTGILIGRIIGQQGSNTPIAVQTVFTTNFSSNQVQNHNDLANIQGGSAGSFNHVTSAQLSLISGSAQGPASSTDSHMALFDGTTGKLIKDGGAVPTVPTAASASEVTTGSDASKYVTPDALAGSGIFGVRAIQIQVVATATDVDGTSGIGYFNIPSSLNGMNLVRAQAYVDTAGTTNATTAQVRNMTKYSSNDSLSAAISIASGGTVGTVGTIDTTYDDVSTDDLIKVYVTAQSSTKPKGLRVQLEYQLP